MSFHPTLASLPGKEYRISPPINNSGLSFGSNSIAICLFLFVIVAIYRKRLLRSQIFHSSNIPPSDSTQMEVNLTVPAAKRLPSNSFNFDSEIFKDVNSEMVHSESVRSTELQTQEKHLSQVLQLASESCEVSIVTSSDNGIYLSDDSKSFIILDDDSTQVNSPSSEKYNLSFEDSDKSVSYADTVLFPLSVTDIDPTLDELAVKLLPEQALRYATKLPLGWQPGGGE